MKYSKATLKAIDSSIAHWERMIKAAMGRRGRVEENLDGFFEKEYWYVDDCALCKKFIDLYCLKCPLKLYGNGCCGDNSPWLKVDEAETWIEWRKAAKNMLKVLKGLKE